MSEGDHKPNPDLLAIIERWFKAIGIFIALGMLWQSSQARTDAISVRLDHIESQLGQFVHSDVATEQNKNIELQLEDLSSKLDDVKKLIR